MSHSFLRSPRLLLALAAAATMPISAIDAGRYNRGVESVHQPVVQRKDYVIDVPADGLDQTDAIRVRQWFDSIGLGYGDRISIDSSAGGTGSNSAIVAIVGDYGLFVNGSAPVTEGTIAPGQARIVVSRSTASVPGCPDYSQLSQPNFTGASSSNFGCGINSTMAAMVADPEDLIGGHATSGSSPETAAKAIRVWRTNDPSGKGALKIESTKGGN